MVRYMNANVVAKGESWRGYLLRLHADQLRSPERKTHAAWTVGTRLSVLSAAEPPVADAQAEGRWQYIAIGLAGHCKLVCTGSEQCGVLVCRSMTCTGHTHTTNVSHALKITSPEDCLLVFATLCCTAIIVESRLNGVALSLRDGHMQGSGIGTMCTACCSAQRPTCGGRSSLTRGTRARHSAQSRTAATGR
jgi:hypothetical protein